MSGLSFNQGLKLCVLAELTVVLYLSMDWSTDVDGIVLIGDMEVARSMMNTKFFMKKARVQPVGNSLPEIYHGGIDFSLISMVAVVCSCCACALYRCACSVQFIHPTIHPSASSSSSFNLRSTF